MDKSGLFATLLFGTATIKAFGPILSENKTEKDEIS